MKIVILHSEVSETAPEDEQDVLAQVETVSSALFDLGYKASTISVNMDLAGLIERLRVLRPDLAFNLVESIIGQGKLIHLVPSILDYLDIPYTGAKTESIFLTSNKVLAKKFLHANGIATPRWFFLEEDHNFFMIEGPYIIKSVWEHASIGLDEDSVIITGDRNCLIKEMMNRQEKLGGACYAEAFIEGREFNLSLLADDTGPEVLPPAEIRFNDPLSGKIRLVGYRAKWDKDSREYSSTPRSFDFSKEDESLLEQLIDLAKRCWDIFRLRGYARVDFRVDQTGLPWILEINTNPCLSPDGGFAAAVQQAGLSFHEAIERIVRGAITSR